MNKEEKYSLGYAICSSIQGNKEKIEKLENQLKRCRKKKMQVENKCSDYKYRIEKATKEIEKELKENNHLSYGVALSIIAILNNYEEILKGDELNEKN